MNLLCKALLGLFIATVSLSASFNPAWASDLPFELLILSGKSKDHNGAVKANNPFATGLNVQIDGSNARYFNNLAELKSHLKLINTPSRILILITAHGGPGGSADLNLGNLLAKDILKTARDLTAFGNRVAILSQACYSGDLLTKMIAQDAAAKTADDKLCVVSDSHPNRTAISSPGLVPDTVVLAQPGQNLNDLYRMMSGGMISSAHYSETQLDQFFNARWAMSRSPVAFETLLQNFRSTVERMEDRPMLKQYTLATLDQSYASFEMGAYQELAGAEASILDLAAFEKNWEKLSRERNLPACLQETHARVKDRVFGKSLRITTANFYQRLQQEVATDQSSAIECSVAQIEKWYSHSLSSYDEWKRSVWRGFKKLGSKFEVGTRLEQAPRLASNLTTPPLSAEILLENIYRGKVGSDLGGNPWFAFSQASLQHPSTHGLDQIRNKACEDFRF